MAIQAARSLGKVLTVAFLLSFSQQSFSSQKVLSQKDELRQKVLSDEIKVLELENMKKKLFRLIAEKGPREPLGLHVPPSEEVLSDLTEISELERKVANLKKELGLEKKPSWGLHVPPSDDWI